MLKPIFVKFAYKPKHVSYNVENVTVHPDGYIRKANGTLTHVYNALLVSDEVLVYDENQSKYFLVTKENFNDVYNALVAGTNLEAIKTVKEVSNMEGVFEVGDFEPVSEEALDVGLSEVPAMVPNTETIKGIEVKLIGNVDYVDGVPVGELFFIEKFEQYNTTDNKTGYYLPIGKANYSKYTDSVKVRVLGINESKVELTGNDVLFLGETEDEANRAVIEVSTEVDSTTITHLMNMKKISFLPKKEPVTVPPRSRAAKTEKPVDKEE